MIELDADFPFLWCLSAESNEGFCNVSMVIPALEADDRKCVTIETSVLSLSSDSSRSEQEEMLEWNQDDIDLFLKMVNARRQRFGLPVADTLSVDITDPDIVDIINVVAAAGFGTAYLSSGILSESGQHMPAFHCQVGGAAALETVAGYKACVVVAMEDDEAICVLLEDIMLDANGEYEHEQLFRHDLLLVKRDRLLHPGFAEIDSGCSKRTLH